MFVSIFNKTILQKNMVAMNAFNIFNYFPRTIEFQNLSKIIRLQQNPKFLIMVGPLNCGKSRFLDYFLDSKKEDLVLMKADLRSEQISKARDFQYVLESTMFNYVQYLLNSVTSKEYVRELIRFFPKWMVGGGNDFNITFNPDHDSERVAGMLGKMVDFHYGKKQLLYGKSKSLLFFLDEANKLKNLSPKESDLQFLKSIFDVLVMKSKQEAKLWVIFSTTDSFLPIVLENLGLVRSGFFKVVTMGHLNSKILFIKCCYLLNLDLEGDKYLRLLGFNKAQHRNFLLKTFGGNIMDLNDCYDVLKDEDDELSYQQKCLMEVGGAKSILYGFGLDDLTEMRKWLFPVLGEQVICI